jgi:RNA polymerase sigma factor (sigma-70 family)
MATKDPPLSLQDDSDPDRLFEEVLQDLPLTIRQVCDKLGQDPRQIEVEDLSQSLVVFLMDNDYARLRTFKSLSAPQTWLFTVVKRYLLRRIRKQIRALNLEALPPDDLSYPAEQENELIAEERLKDLSAALARLTERERRLFLLLRRDGIRVSEIAEYLGVKPRTVYQARLDLIRKIRTMIGH